MVASIFVIVLAQVQLERGVALVTYDRESVSKTTARAIHEQYPSWMEALPDCPCTEKEASADTATWAGGIGGCPRIYHPGAAAGFRSRATVRSAEGAEHGQQCCYDRRGLLINQGPGAGTPDFYSPRSDFWNHLLYDVQPWWDLPWEDYSRIWTPNQGSNAETGEACPANGRRPKQERPDLRMAVKP